MRLKVVAILAFVVALISGMAITYADDPITATILDVDDSAYPDVRAIVTVDRGGQPVTDLRQTDVEAEETGVRATVSRLETVENQQLGLGVILTIDTSGSMYGPKLAAAKSAAAQFVDQLQPADQAAVLSFASQVSTVSDITGDRATTQRALNGLSAFGDTALYSAVGQTIEAARAVPLPRRAIVLLSDGKEDGGHSTINRSQALAAAADARVPFYIIGLGADIDREFLSELARQSGGALLEAPSSSDVNALYAQVAQLLKSQYVITLRSTAAANTADRRLSLRISSTAGTAQARLDYTTRRTISAATAVPAPAIVDEAPPVAETPDSSTSYTGVIAALGGVIVLVLLAGAGLFGYRRMQYRRVTRDITERSSLAAGDLHTSRAASAVPAAPAADVTIAVSGPDATRSARIGREPATIGSIDSNQLQLPDSTGRVAPVHARVWSRDGKLVFHQLSASTPTFMAGKAVDWVTLSPGDEVEIGPYRLRVQPS